MMKTVTLLVIGLLIPILLFAQEEEVNYSEIAWHQYKAGRICFEAFRSGGSYLQVENCLRVQNTCKFIFDGIGDDEKRKWLLEAPSVKKFIVETGLKPLDYLHLLKLISQEQTAKEE